MTKEAHEVQKNETEDQAEEARASSGTTLQLQALDPRTLHPKTNDNFATTLDRFIDFNLDSHIRTFDIHTRPQQSLPPYL